MIVSAEISRMLLIVLVLFIFNECQTSASGKTLLFDLNKDPTESGDLSTSGKSSYAAILKKLKSRSSHWAKAVVNGVAPDSTGKSAAWKKAGGISSWTIDDTFISPVIPKKFSAKNAPNIVFVLVDDWVSIFSHSELFAITYCAYRE